MDIGDGTDDKYDLKDEDDQKLCSEGHRM